MLLPPPTTTLPPVVEAYPGVEAVPPPPPPQVSQTRPPPLPPPPQPPALTGAASQQGPVPTVTVTPILEPQTTPEARESWRRHRLVSRSYGKPIAYHAEDVPARMFLLELCAVDDLLVQVASASQVQKFLPDQVLKSAEQEARTALSVRFRISFIRSDGVEPSHLAGHTSQVGGKLLAEQVRQRKSRRLASAASHRPKGHLPALGSVIVSAGKAAAPASFFFHTGDVGHELLLLIEVLAEVDPLPPTAAAAAASTPVAKKEDGKEPGQAPARQWRVAAVQDATEAGAAPLRRATGVVSGLPSQPKEDYTVVAGLPEADLGQAAVIGWVCVGFHLVTDVQRSQVRLRAGNFREKLLYGRSFEVDAFMRSVEGSRAGMLSYALRRVPPKDIALRLLPPMLPAPAGAQRLGGITSSEVVEGSLFLNEAPACDATVRRLLFTLPDDSWLDDFQLTLAPTRPGETWPQELARPLAGTAKLFANIGSHNGLRWLNATRKALLEAVVHDPGQAPVLQQLVEDAKGHAWYVELLPGDSKAVWRADIEVPVDFVCHKDCAVVIELMAAVEFAPVAIGPPRMKVDPAEVDRRPEGPWQQQVRTIGYAFILPYWDAIEQVTRQGCGNEMIFNNLALEHGPGISVAGRPLWYWDTVAVPRRADRQAPALVSLSLASDTLTQWLRQEHEDQVPMGPLYTPNVGPPSPYTVQAGSAGMPLADAALEQQLLQSASQQADLARQEAIRAQELAQAQAARLAAEQQAQVAAAHAAMQQAAAVQQAAAAVQGVVYQPQPPEGQSFYGLSPEVERIILRDQGTQSDPPPMPEAEDNMISDGRPLTSAEMEAMGDASKKLDIQPTIQPLSQADKAQLVALLGDTGAGRLLQGLPPIAADTGYQRKEIMQRLEEEDPMQADDVSVEFLTFRGISGAPVAERVHFQLRFFLFPPIRTAPAMLSGGPGEACLLRSSVTNERLVLDYNIDGSQLGSAREMHQKLVQYLAARNAIVEVWNTTALMQVGFVQVSLEPLIRQGKPVTKLEIERPILDPVSGEVRGFLKILMSCRARQPGTLSPRGGEHLPKDMGQHSGRKRSRARHKARALVDLNPPASPERATLGGNDDVIMGNIAGKQDRLRQLMQLRGRTDQDLFSEKTALLAEAEDRRQVRKVEEVARRLDRYNTTEMKVDAPFATPTYFYAEITNPYKYQALFNVTIAETTSGQEAPIEGLSQLAEQPLHGIIRSAPQIPLTMVRDPNQWRQLVEWRKVPPPTKGEYDILTAQGQFMLRAYDVVCLPFRYLSFDQSCLERVMQPVDLGGVGLSDMFVGTADRDRRFIIKVVTQQGRVVKRFEVLARARPCIVHRALRFFESEGSPIEKTLALPPRRAFSRGPGTQADGRQVDGDRFVYCTDSEVHLVWRSEDELTLRLKAPASLGIRTFYVMCYSDPNFLHLTAVQSVEVHGLKSEQVRVCVGQYADKTICLPPAEVLDATAVRVYSSDPETVVVQQTPVVDPRFGAKFSVVVAPIRVGVRLCRLHAVDPATQRRITALLLIIVADLPEVKRAHEITLPLNSAVRKRLRYENDSSRPLRFMVRSSDPSLVTVQTPEVVLPAMDHRYIELVCHACPGTTSYKADIFIFIASEDRFHQETRLLQLTYT